METRRSFIKKSVVIRAAATKKSSGAAIGWIAL